MSAFSYLSDVYLVKTVILGCRGMPLSETEVILREMYTSWRGMIAFLRGTDTSLRETNAFLRERVINIRTRTVNIVYAIFLNT
jgi:hypothetical protein